MTDHCLTLVETYKQISALAPTLASSTIRLLLFFASVEGADFTQKEIGAATNLARSSVQKALAEAIDRDLIESNGTPANPRGSFILKLGPKIGHDAPKPGPKIGQRTTAEGPKIGHGTGQTMTENRSYPSVESVTYGGPSRALTRLTDLRSDKVSQSVESILVSEIKSREIRKAFDGLPEESGVPSRSVVRFLEEKIEELRGRQYPITSPKLLLTAAREELPGWIARNSRAITSDVHWEEAEKRQAEEERRKPPQREMPVFDLHEQLRAAAGGKGMP